MIKIDELACVACKTVNAKNGKTYFAPSVVLPDGDVFTFFGSKPYEVGDILPTTIRKIFVDGKPVLAVVLEG